MTCPMQITPFDRLTVDGLTYSNAVVDEAGYTFDRTDQANTPTFYPFEKFRELLRQPGVLLEPGYFTVDREKLRSTGVVNSINTLSGEADTEAIWRYAYVIAFLEYWRSGAGKKTEFSTRLLLPEIEKHVNKQAYAEQSG